MSASAARSRRPQRRYARRERRAMPDGTGAFIVGRRGFLIGSLSAGIMTVGYGVLPASGATSSPANGSPGPATPFSPTIWYEIDGDGIVTVNIAKAEMGQHVGTPLAQAVAEELEADWSQVRIRHVDSDPKWGVMVTG